MIKKHRKNENSQLYAVIGLGRFGFALAKELSSKGKDVLVIDRDREKITAAAEFTEYAYVADSLTQENLAEAGVAEADVAVICIGAKLAVSILTTLHVPRLGVKRVIAKATSPEQGEILTMLGAEVVYPEHDMALRLAGRLVSPHILEYLSLSSTIDIMEIRLTPKVEGKTVLDLNVRRNFGLNIIAIRRDGEITTDIQPSRLLSGEDTLTVIGNAESIARFEEFLR